MMTFMARVLQTPPSRFSRPSIVPLEVAGVEGRDGEEREEERGEMVTRWLISTAVTHRTNQYLPQVLISCSSD